VHVCRNLYFGDAEKFDLYSTSKTRKSVEGKRLTLDFPDLADRVADKLYSDRMSIQKALGDLPLGDRAELKRWRLRCAEMFDRALGAKA
jgi:hypothetical protein